MGRPDDSRQALTFMEKMAGSTAPKGGRCGRRDGGIKGDPFKEQDGCQARLIHSFPREGHELLKMLGFWPEA